MSAAKRKAMGRGLSALLKETGEVNSATDAHAEKIVGAIAEIEVGKIQPNPNQPRTQFSREALEELAISIRELGIIQPITVRKERNGKFTIISGERRYRASKLAKLEKIPAYVRLADDQSMLEMALVENIQREELDPIEIALSYQRLIDECELTQEAMSERVGKKRSTVTNYLRLLKLTPIVQAGLRDKMISMGHARAIITVDDEEEQMKLYERTIARDRSVRQIEDAVRKLRESASSKSGTKSAKQPLPAEYEQIRGNLSDKLSTPVNLSRSKRGKGKIEIPFKNDKELERILNALEIER